jgi:hypothetical protein
MREKHPVFEKVAVVDRDAPVWRYFDFAWTWVTFRAK